MGGGDQHATEYTRGLRPYLVSALVEPRHEWEYASHHASDKTQRKVDKYGLRLAREAIIDERPNTSADEPTGRGTSANGFNVSSFNIHTTQCQHSRPFKHANVREEHAQVLSDAHLAHSSMLTRCAQPDIVCHITLLRRQSIAKRV